MWMRFAVLSLSSLVATGCSDRPATKTASPANATTGSGSGSDPCAIAVDKLFALIATKGAAPAPDQRASALAECRNNPNDPTLACIVGASGNAAVEACLDAPKGEPIDQLEAATEKLRTYYFVNETFTIQKLPLIPARACCTYPDKKCPPETSPGEWWTDVVGVDLSTPRSFQYRFESSGDMALIEAVGDRNCDGKTVTYRRELERRGDGNMHVTVTDPPPDSD